MASGIQTSAGRQAADILLQKEFGKSVIFKHIYCTIKKKQKKSTKCATEFWQSDHRSFEESLKKKPIMDEVQLRFKRNEKDGVDF